MSNYTITVPIVLDASGDANIFSEDVVTTDVSYVFTMNAGHIAASDLSGFVRYIDDNSDNTLFAYSETSKSTVKGQFETDICNTNLVHNTTDGASFPNHTPKVEDATIGEMLVKYIASVLFGHPEAQAPIENDQDIVDQVQVSSNLGGQFVNTLSAGLNDLDTEGNATVSAENEVLQSIFEQLVSFSSETDASGGATPDSNRFGDRDDTGVYRGLPFLTGDTIIFLVRMKGSINHDTTEYNLDPEFTTGGDSTLATLFGSNPELTNNGGTLTLNDKIWELRVTIV